MTAFEKYFNKSYESLKGKSKDIDSLLRDEMLLISGDFYGIQKFIFEGLSTKNASKILRAKSAFIELFTITLSRYICKELEIEEKHILTANAGKFEILSPNITPEKIDDIQKAIDTYFIKNFYGLSGVNICYTPCKKEDFLNREKYRQLRAAISKVVEAKKFRKFDLQNQPSLLEYDNDIDNSTLCKLCNIRKEREKGAGKCRICEMFVALGRDLVSNKKSISSKNGLMIELNGFDTEIELDKRIKSYIQKGENGEPADFEKLAKASEGVGAIAVLKADVDNMGIFIKESDITESFENFSLFSKTLDNFFSIHIPDKMREKFPDTYTVFAGGDDLFLLGSWDIILELARFIRCEFKDFVKDENLSISFGIAIAKPSTPISYLAEHTEHLLEKSKAVDKEKNAITLFNETVKWDKYLKIFEKLKSGFENIRSEEIKTAFLYRLLELIEMSKKVKYENDIPSTAWKSKLSYSFSRNMDEKHKPLFNTLDEMIEKYPKETKMALCEFIYKRRI